MPGIRLNPGADVDAAEAQVQGRRSAVV